MIIYVYCEAGLVLALMREVLVDVYQSPARVARAQAARQEREASQARIAALTSADLVVGSRW